MSHRTSKSFLAAAALLGSLMLAPSAQAMDRDTGVGHDIAAQGNRAIAVIRAEFKAAAENLFKPVLPKGRIKKVSAPAAPAGSVVGKTIVEATPARCAE